MTIDAEYHERLQLIRSAGLTSSEADAKRVLQSVQASLAALDGAVNFSLFDTEPQTFDVVLRKLARPTSDG